MQCQTEEMKDVILKKCDEWQAAISPGSMAVSAREHETSTGHPSHFVFGPR